MKWSLEHMEQQGFVTWFRLKYPEVLIYAVPNGEHRAISTAKKLREEGVVSGVPDLHVPEWNLWIEMKRVSGSTVSQEQKRIHEYLQGIGHTVIVGWGAEDASRQILDLRRKYESN